MAGDPDLKRLRQLETAFRSLKPKHQRLIQYARVDRLSYAEIAQRLSTSIAQVERRMARAILALDRALDHGERPWWRFW
jgi:RNA polymerase sigma factor (sigma-70 family)